MSNRDQPNSNCVAGDAHLPGRIWAIGMTIAMAFFLIVCIATPSALARDDLAPVVPKEASFTAQPAKLLSATESSDVKRIVDDARTFGLPFAVRVVSVSAVPQSGESQSAANRLYADSPVESTSGADDGLLLLVQVPESNPSLTTAAFTHGAKFFPRGGVTQERLDSTLANVMIPLFQKGKVGTAVVTGTSWVAYDQLFLPSPRLERTNGQKWLARIADIPLLAIMVAAGILYAGWALAVHRRTRSYPVTDLAPLTSPFAAGTISRGRVDRSVDTAAVVSLLDSGSVQSDAKTSRRDRMSLQLIEEPARQDPFLNHVWQTLSAIADPESGMIAASSLSRLSDALAPVRRWQAEDLAASGYLIPRGVSQNRWLMIGGGGVFLLAVYCIAPAMISMSRWSLFIAAALIVEVILIVWWATRRSFATDAGRRAVSDWKASVTARIADGDQDAITDRNIYTLITRQDNRDLDSAGTNESHGQAVPQLIATMRGFGTV